MGKYSQNIKAGMVMDLIDELLPFDNSQVAKKVIVKYAVQVLKINRKVAISTIKSMVDSDVIEPINIDCAIWYQRK